MEESKQRKVGAILSYVSIIVSTVIQLIYTPFLIRMLGQNEYGLYSLIASIIGYLTVLDLGFGNAIIVYTAKYKAKNEIEKEKRMQGMFKIVFYIIGLFTAVIGLALYFNVNYIFGETLSSYEINKAKIMMLILTFNLVITFAFNIYSSIINAYEKFTFQKVLSIINTLLKPIIMIPLLFLGFKSIAMCVAITIVNIIVILSNYYYCRYNLKINIHYQGFDKKLFLEMFGYSFFLFLGVIVDKVNWSVDQFILGSISGTIAVSIYSIASQLNQMFINLSVAVSGVLLPKMSKMIAKKATSEELTNEMVKVGRIQYYIIFLIASGLVLFGKQFIMWWAGSNFGESYYVALILIIPLCFPLIQNLGLSIIQAMNKHKFRTIVMAIMSIFNIIISVILAHKYGAIGTAIGTAISLIICNVIIMNIYYYKVIKINIFNFWLNIVQMTIPFIIPIVLIILIRYCFYINSLIGMFFYISIYTILYIVTSYFLVMNSYEKTLINKLFFKIFKK